MRELSPEKETRELRHERRESSLGDGWEPGLGMLLVVHVPAPDGGRN